MNGRASGHYLEWHSNGTFKLETMVIGGIADVYVGAEKSWLFDGLSRAWDENGALLVEIYYTKGALEGVSTYYHSNGNIWKTIPYRKNKVQGTAKIFLDTGDLLQTTEYNDGQKQGSSIRYWDPKRIASKEQFQKDLLISGEYYDRKGQKISEVTNGNGYRAIFGKDAVAELQEYRKGILEGEIKVFSANGKLKRLYHVRNGFKHGEEVYYDDLSSKPRLSIHWYEDAIQGPAKTWYPNGVLESQREMLQNKKNGLSMAWYQDGSLMMIEEYDHNKIVKGEYFNRGEKIPLSKITKGNGIATIFDENGNFLHKINYQNGKPVIQN